MSSQTKTNIAKRIASGYLPKQQMKQMGVAVEILCMSIAFILFYQLVELIARYKLDDLGEYKLTLIHNHEVPNNKTN